MTLELFLSLVLVISCAGAIWAICDLLENIDYQSEFEDTEYPNEEDEG